VTTKLRLFNNLGLADDDVGSPYGAPMGRAGVTDDPAATVNLFRVRFTGGGYGTRFDDGDYDLGGAYWGGGPDVNPLWCAWGEGFRVFRRAATRADAKAALAKEYPDLKFRR